MSIVRAIVAVVIFIIFCWLNWWVLPDLAIVRFSPKGTPIPQIGCLFVAWENKDVTGHRVVSDIVADWSGVPAAWPYVVVGVLLGLWIGYVVGELARRKFAIDMASQEAINSAKEIYVEVKMLDKQADGKLSQAANMKKNVAHMQNVLSREIEEYRSARAKADQQISHGEEMQQKVEATERELTKARRTIEKLERQTKRLKRENEEKN